MPQRHTKNNGSSTYGVFSRTERSKCEFMNSLQMRAGADSQLPFGWCSLSLQPAVDPVVTPSGHVYSRECLLEHMVTKAADLKRQREKWEREQAAAEAERAARAAEDREALNADFEHQNDPRATSIVVAAKPAPQEKAEKKRPREEEKESEAEKSKRIEAELRAPVATAAMIQRAKDGMASNFWLPQFTPSHAPEPTPEPERRPPSPVTGKPLRAKDLVPLRLEASRTLKTNGSGQEEVKYLCHVSHKEINAQPVLLIRTTGCVLLEDVAKKLGVLESKVCPISSRPFKAKDVVKLQSGVSAFAASGGEALNIKVYRANGGGA